VNLFILRVISQNEWIYASVSSIPGELKILTPDQVITYWQTADILEIEERNQPENISEFALADSENGWAI